MRLLDAPTDAPPRPTVRSERERAVADRLNAAPAPSARRVDDVVVAVCGLSWAAALIHAEAAVEHAEVAVLHSVFFAAAASFQFLWGIVAYHRPTPRLLWTGAAFSLAIALLWVLSRTSGVPIGPGAWTPEPVGLSDVLATADELVLALAVLVHLRARGDRGPAVALRAAIAAAGVSLVLLSSLAVTFSSGHPHAPAAVETGLPDR